MRSSDLKRAKRLIRREVLTRRDGLSAEERRAAGEAIAERLLGSQGDLVGTVVLVYWAFGSEVPTSSLMAGLREAGALVALPRIDGDRLQILAYRDGDQLTETSFGAMEPAGGAEIAPDGVDLIATPAVAFDLEGRRIGYGGGFYDRLFPHATGARRVGVAYDLQIVEGPLPSGHLDLRVHAICTPTRLIDCGGPT